MLKRIATYTTIALALCACSDEDFTLPNGVGEDGSLDIRIAVPEMQTVTTRAGVDEDAVNSITMLVISESSVAQVASYSGSDISLAGNNEYSLSVKLDPSIRSNSNLRFYFIANSSATFDKGYAEEAVMQETYTDVINSDGSMTMSGTADLATLTSGTSAPLYRNAAKVSVSAGREVASETDPDQKEIEILSNNYDFSVFGTAADASVVAGTSVDLAGDPTAATLTTEVATDPAAYIHPTKATSGALRPYVVLKATYNGADYYYRVDFRNKADDGSIKDLDLESNHWYKVVVTAINGAGSATVADAAKNPSPLVEATIYDVVPESYNMVTDGIRELGVSHELLYEGEPGLTEDIYVKLYSPNDSEYPEPTVDAWKSRSEKLVSTTYRWLTLDAVEDVTETFTDATTTNGKVYKLSVKFNATETPGTLNALINVDWQGLHREIPVTWKREFKGSDLCSVALTIKPDEGSDINYDNYWSFLKEKVNGVTAEQNGGNIRDEGLHFPVMYGDVEFDDNGTPTYKTWTYSYTVTYNAKVIENAEWKLSSDLPEVKLSATSGTGNGSPLTVDVTWNGNSWDYKTGTLLLEVANADGGWTKYPLDVYHTGFFHDHTAEGISEAGKSTSDYRVGGQPAANKPIYYYEVLEGPSGNHWLDRNLGATASGLYIATSAGADYYGNPAAAGGYYRAAGYVNGGNPKMYEGLCPPGYEVPREETWNSVRNSTWFSTSQSGSYYDASMRCTNGMRIYFPKVGYYAENTRTGESRAGYYWSSTAASGLEKDQIGNWLRCLQFSGSVTTFINGQVQGRSSANGYAMSVRCVGKTPESKDTYRTDFNVSGATHVYIYSVNANGSRNIVYPWPGKAIGNYSTVKTDGSTMMNFSYESKTTPAEKFYVIFSYKDASGKIHTVSKTSDGNTLYSTNQNPANLNGWRVVGDKSFSGTTTACGGTWNVTSPTTESAVVSYGGHNSSNSGQFVIYLCNLENWDDVTLVYQIYQGGLTSKTEKKGELVQNFYPKFYKFTIALGPNDDGIGTISFKHGTAQTSTISNESYLSNGTGENKIPSGSYFNNYDMARNKVLPSQVPEAANDKHRVNAKNVTSWIRMNIYYWFNSGTQPNWPGYSMTNIYGPFYYYDMPNNAAGFLMTSSSYKGDKQKQTNDLQWSNNNELFETSNDKTVPDN